MPGTGTPPKPKPSKLRTTGSGHGGVKPKSFKPKIELFYPDQRRANEAAKKAIKGIVDNAKAAKKVLTGK